MAYHQDLASRVRGLLNALPGYEEKMMFGGVGFFVYGNMACGVLGDDLIVRIGPPEFACALRLPHAQFFDFSCGPMPGWMRVDPGGTKTDAELAAWVESGAGFARAMPGK